MSEPGHIDGALLNFEDKAPALVIAEMFLGLFEKTPGADNYLEFSLTSSLGGVVVTARRADGKSPNQLRCEADEKVKELVAALDGLMTLESRGRVMPFGREWDAARAAIAKATPSP